MCCSFTTCFFSLFRRGRDVLDEVSVLNALIVKALSDKQVMKQEQTIQECLEFLRNYAATLQSWTCLSSSDMETVIHSLASMAFTHKLDEKIKLKKGSNQRKDFEETKAMNPALQEAALEALKSLLDNCHDSFNESQFDVIVDAVIRELICHAKESSVKIRKLLLLVLRSLLLQPTFIAKRPTQPSIVIFGSFSSDSSTGVASIAKESLMMLTQVLRPIFPSLGSENEGNVSKSGDSDEDLDYGESGHVDSSTQVMEGVDDFGETVHVAEETFKDTEQKETQADVKSNETSSLDEVSQVKIVVSSEEKTSEPEKTVETECPVITLDSPNDKDIKEQSDSQNEKTNISPVRRSSRLARNRKETGSDSTISEKSPSNPKKKSPQTKTSPEKKASDKKTVETKVAEEDEEHFSGEVSDILAGGAFD